MASKILKLSIPPFSTYWDYTDLDDFNGMFDGDLNSYTGEFKCDLLEGWTYDGMLSASQG